MKSSLSASFGVEKFDADTDDCHIDDPLSILLQQLAFGSTEKNTERHGQKVEMLSFQETSHTAAETQSEDTLFDHHYSIHYVRESIEDALNTLHTSKSELSETMSSSSKRSASVLGSYIKSSLSISSRSSDGAKLMDSDDLMYEPNMDADLLELDDIISDCSYRQAYSPSLFINEFPFFSIITTNTTHNIATPHSIEGEQERPETPFYDDLFEQVDTTLQNMESIIDCIALNQGEHFNTIMEEKDKEIMSQIQIQQQMSNHIHQLHSETEKARNDSLALSTKVQVLESALNEKLDQEKVLTNKVSLLQGIIQLKNEELLEMDKSQGQLKTELRSATTQIQTLTRDLLNNQVELSSLQNIVTQKETELEMLGKTFVELNEQLSHEFQRNKDACEHKNSLEQTIQDMRRSMTTIEEREIKTLSQLSTLENILHEKDSEIYALKTTLSAISSPRNDIDTQSPKKELDLMEKFHTAETGFRITLEKVQLLENCVHDKGASIRKLEKCVSEAHSLLNESFEEHSLRSETRNLFSDSLSECDKECGTSSTARNLSVDDYFNQPTPDRGRALHSERKSESASSKDASLETVQIYSEDTHLNLPSTSCVLIEGKTVGNEDLMLDAEHVIRTLEMKIISLEKSLMAYKNQHMLENTYLLSDDELDCTHIASPLKAKRLYDSVEVNDTKILENGNSLMSQADIEEKMNQETSIRLSVLETENRMKDRMIDNLCQQICGLKSCLEELLESDRLYENEYKRQLLDAEEKCRMLLHERDSLLDETLKMFQEQNI